MTVHFILKGFGFVRSKDRFWLLVVPWVIQGAKNWIYTLLVLMSGVPVKVQPTLGVVVVVLLSRLMLLWAFYFRQVLMLGIGQYPRSISTNPTFR